MGTVIILELVVGEKTAAAVDLGEGASADGIMVGKVKALAGDAVFPAGTTAASPSVRTEMVRLVAAVDMATTTVRSGATGLGDAPHLKRGARITTLELSRNRKDYSP